MTDNSYLEDLYSLKYIERYNNLPRIKSESVAEHSYFVALITARLANKYKFNIGEALLTAVIHDIFEIYISDIPRNVKDKFPKIKPILNKIEENIIIQKYPEYKKLIENFNKQLTPEGMIVKLADNLSVLQYANTEIGLGNNVYMPKVKAETLVEIAKIEKKLEKYKK